MTRMSNVADAAEPDLSPAEIRARCRTGEFRRPTAGFARGFVQANLVVLPADWAEDFRLFCERNPKPCPLLEAGAPGDPATRFLASGADVRTDVPLYRIFENGEYAREATDLSDVWRDDFVFFLLGCSFSFEAALLREGLPVRHLEERRADRRPKNVPMYRTNVACEPAGAFRGPLVVSMRPYTPADAHRAAAVTSRFPRMHGGPVQIGEAEALGVARLDRPDWGDAVSIRPGEIPVFWACGVTPQAALEEARPPIAATHAPGHMFVCDRRDEEFEIL
jgi:uncharacterized protein YcsI (UPF0317 family)